MLVRSVKKQTESEKKKRKTEICKVPVNANKNANKWP